MKSFLLIDNNLTLARATLIKAVLTTALQKKEWAVVPHLADAELVLIIGQPEIPSAILAGKKVFISDALEKIIQSPEEFLHEVATNALPYQPDQSAATSKMPARETVKHIVAVTACPTGVAHTYMAAEAISNEAAKRGWSCKVETRGSVGAGNELNAAEIAQADVVIIAADIEVDLNKFIGKKLYRTSTSAALKQTAQELDKAESQSELYQPAVSTKTETKAGTKKGAYAHLLTGVSYMLPMVVAGGLLIALSFAVGGVYQEGVLAQALAQIGGATAFKLMVPLLAGYIAFSIADRPGLVPGLIGGMLADSMGAGFLGGILAGYLAGYSALLIARQLRLPQSMEALKPILIIPLFSSLLIGLLMIFVVGSPVAKLMQELTLWLNGMGTTNAVILGAILGGMMCTDMGGPINKAAYAFGVGLLSSSVYTPMAAIMAAGMVPPLAMGLATLIAPKKFAETEREGGKAALVLGLCFISEGAIPFAARDPMRVLPLSILGGALTGAISMAVGAKLMAPHGGLFVLAIPGAITHLLSYLLAILAGTMLTGLLYGWIKRPESGYTALEGETTDNGEEAR